MGAGGGQSPGAISSIHLEVYEMAHKMTKNGGTSGAPKMTNSEYIAKMSHDVIPGMKGKTKSTVSTSGGYKDMKGTMKGYGNMKGKMKGY